MLHSKSSFRACSSNYESYLQTQFLKIRRMITPLTCGVIMFYYSGTFINDSCDVWVKTKDKLKPIQ